MAWPILSLNLPQHEPNQEIQPYDIYIYIKEREREREREIEREREREIQRFTSPVPMGPVHMRAFGVDL